MADIRIKLLLLDDDNELGNGLLAIRTLESQMIDITDWDAGMSDSTNTGADKHRYIKDNKMYVGYKSYFDFDRNTRVILAVQEFQPFDVLPE